MAVRMHSRVFMAAVNFNTPSSVLGRARKIGELSKAVGIARMGVLGPQEIQFGLLSADCFEADRTD